MSAIQDFRNFYARDVVSSYGKAGNRLVAAFAKVERSTTWARALEGFYTCFRLHNSLDASAWCVGEGWWL